MLGLLAGGVMGVGVAIVSWLIKRRFGLFLLALAAFYLPFFTSSGFPTATGMGLVRGSRENPQYWVAATAFGVVAVTFIVAVLAPLCSLLTVSRWRSNLPSIAALVQVVGVALSVLLLQALRLQIEGESINGIGLVSGSSSVTVGFWVTNVMLVVGGLSAALSIVRKNARWATSVVSASLGAIRDGEESASYGLCLGVFLILETAVMVLNLRVIVPWWTAHTGLVDLAALRGHVSLLIYGGTAAAASGAAAVALRQPRHLDLIAWRHFAAVVLGVLTVLASGLGVAAVFQEPILLGPVGQHVIIAVASVLGVGAIMGGGEAVFDRLWSKRASITAATALLTSLLPTSVAAGAAPTRGQPPAEMFPGQCELYTEAGALEASLTIGSWSGGPEFSYQIAEGGDHKWTVSMTSGLTAGYDFSVLGKTLHAIAAIAGKEAEVDVHTSGTVDFENTYEAGSRQQAELKVLSAYGRYVSIVAAPSGLRVVVGSRRHARPGCTRQPQRNHGGLHDGCGDFGNVADSAVGELPGNGRSWKRDST